MSNSTHSTNPRNSGNSDRGFLKGLLPFSGFMDTGEEWHAFIIGLFEVLCPCRPRHPDLSPHLAECLRTEYHYYMWGRALAILAWIAIGCVIKELIF